MIDESEQQRADMLRQLEEMNEQLRKQRSFSHAIKYGMYYGVGFVIGSTVLAAIILGILLKLFGDWPIIKALVETAKEVSI